MNIQRIVGIVLLVAGIALFVTGTNSSHSFADQMSNTFTGRFTDNTNWYIISGIVSGVAGVLMLVLGLRGKNA